MRKQFREQTRKLCDILKLDGGDLRLSSHDDAVLGVIQDVASEVLKLKMEAMAWQKLVKDQQRTIEKMKTLLIGE